MIAQALHQDMSMSKIQEELRHLRFKSTEQTNQIRELFARDEMSASKAELHAAMAGLTFKNRAESTSDILGNAIQKIFEGNRNSHNSKQQTKDIQSFLANPYEAIAVLAEKMGKIEAQHAEDRRSAAKEVEKLQGEITRLRSGTEDINFQVFKLQTGMSKVSKYKSNVDNVIPKPPTLVVQMDPLDLATSMMGIQTPDPEDSVGSLDVDDNTSHQGSRSSREDDESERNDNFSNHIQEVTPPVSSPEKRGIPIETVLPSRKRTSTIRLPNREGPVLQRLQEYEIRTDKRLTSLEASDVLVKKLMSAISVLSKEHELFNSFKTEATGQLVSQRENFEAVIKQLVAVVEQCVVKLNALTTENEENMILHTQVEDIRRDLQCVIQETMRAARPEENGVIFKSLSLADRSSDMVPMSMMSKDIPGIEDVKALVDGLKTLDVSFRKNVQMVEKLSLRQEDLVQDVSSVEDNLQKLKYLVLHSIQLPAKPTVVAPPPKKEESPAVLQPKQNRQLEGYEVKLDRPLSSSACRGPSSAVRVHSAPSSSLNKRGHTAPSPSPAVEKFCDEDFFTGGNFQLTEQFPNNNGDLGISSDTICKETPPPGTCPSHVRNQSGVRSKRMQGMDLVKGIAATRKKGSHKVITASPRAGVNEDTLRNLSLEWGSDSAARLKSDDWSRTIEDLRRKGQKKGTKETPQPQHPPINVKFSPERTVVKDNRDIFSVSDVDRVSDSILDGVSPRYLDSSPSKDFMSIMSSITDVDIT